MIPMKVFFRGDHFLFSLTLFIDNHTPELLCIQACMNHHTTQRKE